jgi:hypothetical protein
MLEKFKKDEFGLYIYAENYKEVRMSFESYEKVKEAIDKKKRSRKGKFDN